MTLTTARCPVHRLGYILCLFLTLPAAGNSQVALTGAIQFATNPSGAFAENQSWNTYGGDECWDLWLAQNPDASSPLNGPSDQQAGINMPLSVGSKYHLYMFGAPDLTISLNGLNLFFNGDDTTPGISVFGATNSSLFSPDSSSGTRTLSGGTVAGSGKGFYSSSDAVVVLTGYNWNAPATPPGNVAQAFEFAPEAENTPDFFGSFTLEVFRAATLGLSQTGGPPGTPVVTAGSGFDPQETVAIYVNQIGGLPLITTTADAGGTFTGIAREPQTPYGAIDFYAVGARSGKLGAASFFVSAALRVAPDIGVPGNVLAAAGFGFGAGETVDLYWREPRQLLGTTIADGQGTAALKITIPANAQSGINGVFGVGGITQATAGATVFVQ